MSHSTGAIKFKDNTIRYYEYDGTSDVVISHHYKTLDEVGNNWRKAKWLKCNCLNEEPVSIFSQDGLGFYIEGKACKECKSVTSNEDDFDRVERDQTEDWANKMLKW